MKDLVRVVSIGKMPILLQGDTSVGKTSLITYLAKASGHICVRINNHEHTDLQEYVGTYVADSTGKLVFKEGVLVDAMRKGTYTKSPITHTCFFFIISIAYYFQLRYLEMYCISYINYSAR